MKICTIKPNKQKMFVNRIFVIAQQKRVMQGARSLKGKGAYVGM